MGVITFNGVTSTSVNIEVEHQPHYVIAERDFEFVHVPGRNGDFLIDSGSYKNVKQSYDIAFINDDLDFFSAAHEVSRWLSSAPGYAVLVDSYDPLYYRLATYHANTKLTDLLGMAGRATIEFTCKPQRFLLSGDTATSITTSGTTITNPLDKPSKPQIVVHGSGNGEFMIGNYHVTITGIQEGMTIDSEVEDCYLNGATVANAVVFESGYPLLDTGESLVTFNGGISSLDVTPRWWTL